MDKICKEWIEVFEFAKINFQVFNNGYHIKVGEVNFYPTKKSYWNERTEKKGYWNSIEDVKRIISKSSITPEDVFKEIASNMMVRFNYKEFKESHYTLHKAIIESMKAWKNKD
jgi:hypothetical protein